MFLGTRRRRAAVAVSCLAVAVTTAVAGADSRAAAPPRPIVYVNAYGTYAVRPDGTSWRQLNDCTLTPVAATVAFSSAGSHTFRTAKRRS